MVRNTIPKVEDTRLLTECGGVCVATTSSFRAHICPRFVVLVAHISSEVRESSGEVEVSREERCGIQCRSYQARVRALSTYA